MKPATQVGLLQGLSVTGVCCCLSYRRVIQFPKASTHGCCFYFTKPREINTRLSQFSNSVKSSIRGKMKSYKKNGWGYLAAFPWELLIFFILILPRMSRTTSSWAILSKHGKIMPVSRAVTSPRLWVLKALSSIQAPLKWLHFLRFIFLSGIIEQTFFFKIARHKNCQQRNVGNTFLPWNDSVHLITNPSYNGYG